MRSILRKSTALIAVLAVLAFLPSTARAEVLTSEGLDQVLAPVALYPDSLLGNVLLAATWPDQVVSADQWRKANPNVSQGNLAAALAGYNWDDSVKALVALPDVLSRLAGDMDWTVELGQAFVNQTDDVYDSIQRLRRQAQSTGALVDSDGVDVVTDDGGYVMVGSTDPAVIVVPTYEPEVVYGWRPGAVVATTALVWGTVQILDDRFYGSCWDWYHHRFWVGPGYGACGYWNGNVRAWGGGNTININNTNINNVRNRINTNINNGNINWHAGTRPGTDGVRWQGANGYPAARDAAAARAGLRPGGVEAGGIPATRPDWSQRPNLGSITRPDGTRPDWSQRPDLGTPRNWDRSGSVFGSGGSGTQARWDSARGSQVFQNSPFGGSRSFSRPSGGGFRGRR